MPRPITENTLYYGDNLPILRDHISDDSIDLVYLDPPFNSNRSYNVLFREESGQESGAQVAAFEDSWHWNQVTEQVYQELLTETLPHVGTAIAALRALIGTNQMMAYLVMMAVRLVELHRVLKPTGSLYLHCDPTASHYLKVVLDAIFGGQNFRNEIIWQRTSSHSDSRRWGAVHDTIFFYSKSGDFHWNAVYTEHDPKYVAQFYRYHDERGVYRLDHIIRSATMGPRPNLAYEYKGYTPQWGWRVMREKLVALDGEGRLAWSKSGRPYLKRYLHEQKGTAIRSVITDIGVIGAQAVERMGYPTQKPLALLERIIQASSNPGDLILDPFCGCGTAVVAAQKLGRRWIGIDISHLAISLVRARLHESFPAVQFRVIGEPEDLEAARQLAGDNRHQFEWWALSRVRARPVGSTGEERQGKKGRDRGIDGVIIFVDEPKGKPKRALVQVKSGHVSSRDVRDLRGTVEREQAAIGVFLTLEPPTREMLHEATVAGAYHSPGWNRDYPRLQILTITELLAGAEVSMPPAHHTFTPAQRIIEEGKQRALL